MATNNPTPLIACLAIAKLNLKPVISIHLNTGICQQCNHLAFRKAVQTVRLHGRLRADNSAPGRSRWKTPSGIAKALIIISKTLLLLLPLNSAGLIIAELNTGQIILIGTRVGSGQLAQITAYLLGIRSGRKIGFHTVFYSERTLIKISGFC